LRFINTLLAAAFGMLVVLLAVSNLGTVSVEIWPFPFRIEAGLYAVILVAVFAGFVAGSIAAWMGGAERRRELRAARKRMREMEQSLARLKDDAAAARAKAELSQPPKI
jgi:lipopolysaccharide assembly protein A